MNSYDIIVAGGGFAGVAAAIAAARGGAKVLLFDKTNCLGGAAANGLVNPFMAYWTRTPDGARDPICNGIFKEILDELKRAGALDKNENGFDEEILKLILNRMTLDAGVTLLYNATLHSADVADGRINSVTVMTVGGNLTFLADVFIDATGDGELSMLSGCRFRLGRPDGLCQPMTLCFRIGNVDISKYRVSYKTVNEKYKAAQAQGRIKNPREDVMLFDTLNEGVVHVNSTRVVKRDPTDAFDVTAAEIEAREQAFELHNLLKNEVDGFQNSRVLSTAMRIGTRESRMIEGEYTLTEDDLKSLRRFPDAIAVGNYDIDIHNPEGGGTSHYFFKPGEWYEIPYRCLLPKDARNLIVAGRCISVSHEAQASIRIMPIVCCIGEAAGTAAAVAFSDKTEPKTADIDKIKSLLRAGGARI